MTEFAFPPQGIISREQGNRTKAGEGGRYVFPSFFVPSSILARPPSFLLACSPVSPFLLRPRLQKTAFYLSLKKGKRGRPPSVQDRHLFPFGKKPKKRMWNTPFSVLFLFPSSFASKSIFFFLGKLSFSSLLRNASSCHPLRREKEKKEIAMLSESVVRREESPSFLLFPPEGRSRHFSQKRKRKKRREHRNPSSRRKTLPVGGREKEKKEKAKERNPHVCRAPVLGKRAKRKGGVSILWSGSSLLQKKGNASRCGIRKRRKGKPSPAHRGESPLAFLSEKRKEEKKSTVLSLPPLLFRMFPLLHSSKRREAASNRYAGCSKRC